jgi:hypothetical protein
VHQGVCAHVEPDRLLLLVAGVDEDRQAPRRGALDDRGAHRRLVHRPDLRRTEAALDRDLDAEGVGTFDGGEGAIQIVHAGDAEIRVEHRHVPVARRDRRAEGQEIRTRFSVRQPGPDLGQDLGADRGVENRGHAASQEGAELAAAERGHDLGRVRAQLAAGNLHQMNVCVDQPGQHGRAADVELRNESRLVRRRPVGLRAECHDASVPDQDRDIVPGRRAGSVHQPRVTDQE